MNDAPRNQSRAIAVWLLQLVFPTLGLVPVVGRLTGRHAPGTYTWALLGFVVAWCAGCLTALGVRTARRWICAHPAQLIALYTSTLTGLVVIELYYRQRLQNAWQRHPTVISAMQYSRELGWKLVPGKDGVGEHGWRGPYRAAHKGKGCFRIVCVGDSTTYGFSCRWDEAWPHQLELLLNADSSWTDAHGKTEVVNLGVPSFGTDQELLALKNEGLSFQPDAVILHLCVNDFEDVTVDRQSESRGVAYHKPLFALEHGRLVLKLDYAPLPRHLSGRVYKAGDPLYFGPHSAFLQKVERWIERRDSGGNLGKHLWPIRDDCPEEYARARPLLWALVREIANTSTAAGSRFLVTLSPTVMNAPTDVPPWRVGSFLEEYQADAAAVGVPAINCIAEFAAERGNARFLADKDPFHLNGAGNALLARQAMRWLKANTPAPN